MKIDYKLKKKIDGLYSIKTFAVKNTRFGNKFLDLSLSSNTGDVKARFWDIDDSEEKMFNKDDKVRVVGILNKFGNQLYIDVSYLSFIEITEDEILNLDRTYIPDLNDLVKPIEIDVDNGSIIMHTSTYGEESLEIVKKYFNQSNYIFISTYNISKKFLKDIETYFNNKKVTIFTNIPDEQEKLEYLELLKPDYFWKGFSSYINLKNHSKIILTDCVAYVGSSNASNSNNIECGIIIEDTATINAMKSQLFYWLKQNSFQYKFDTDIILSKIEQYLKTYKNILNNYLEDEFLFITSEPYGKNELDDSYIFIPNPNMNDLQESFRHLNNILNRLEKYVLNYRFNDQILYDRSTLYLVLEYILRNIEKIRKVISKEGPLQKTLNRYSDTDFDKVAERIYKDKLDSYDSDTQYEVINEAQDCAYQLNQEAEEEIYEQYIHLQSLIATLFDKALKDIENQPTIKKKLQKKQK